MKHPILLVLLVLLAACSLSACTATTDSSTEVGAGGVTVSGKVETHEDKIAAQKEILLRQKEEKARQERERQDLERQDFHNKKLEGYLESK